MRYCIKVIDRGYVISAGHNDHEEYLRPEPAAEAWWAGVVWFYDLSRAIKKAREITNRAFVVECYSDKFPRGSSLIDSFPEPECLFV